MRNLQLVGFPIVALPVAEREASQTRQNAVPIPTATSACRGSVQTTNVAIASGTRSRDGHKVGYLAIGSTSSKRSFYNAGGSSLMHPGPLADAARVALESRKEKSPTQVSSLAPIGVGVSQPAAMKAWPGAASHRGVLPDGER